MQPRRKARAPGFPGEGGRAPRMRGTCGARARSPDQVPASMGGLDGSDLKHPARVIPQMGTRAGALRAQRRGAKFNTLIESAWGRAYTSRWFPAFGKTEMAEASSTEDVIT